jgi:hypothetical protein
MHSGLKQILHVAMQRKLIHMDDQGDRIATRKFTRPTDNKFFCIIVEIPLMEWRRIHRVEKLLDSVDKNLDSMKRSLTWLQV